MTTKNKTSKKQRTWYSVTAFGYALDGLHNNRRIRVRQSARLCADNMDDAKQGLLECYPNINNWLECGFVVSPVADLSHYKR